MLCIALGEKAIQVLKYSLHPKDQDSVLFPKLCQGLQQLLAGEPGELRHGVLAIVEDDLLVVGIEPEGVVRLIAKLYNDRVRLHESHVGTILEDTSPQIGQKRLHALFLNEFQALLDCHGLQVELDGVAFSDGSGRTRHGKASKPGPRGRNVAPCECHDVLSLASLHD